MAYCSIIVCSKILINDNASHSVNIWVKNYRMKKQNKTEQKQNNHSNSWVAAIIFISLSIKLKAIIVYIRRHMHNIRCFFTSCNDERIVSLPENEMWRINYDGFQEKYHFCAVEWCLSPVERTKWMFLSGKTYVSNTCTKCCGSAEPVGINSAKCDEKE